MTQLKTCPDCSTEKERSEFGCNKANKDGLSSYCMICKRARNNAHRLANPEKIKERKRIANLLNPNANRKRSKDFYKANKERLLAYSKDYYEKRKEVVREYKRVYLQENRLKEYARKNEWANQNRGIFTASKARRRAKKLSATPAWVNHDAIKGIYDQAFNATVETGIAHHVDHIIPLQSEIVCGLHWEGNLTVMTAKENIQKSNVRWPDMP